MNKTLRGACQIQTPWNRYPHSGLLQLINQQFPPNTCDRQRVSTPSIHKFIKLLWVAWTYKIHVPEFVSNLSGCTVAPSELRHQWPNVNLSFLSQGPRGKCFFENMAFFPKLGIWMNKGRGPVDLSSIQLIILFVHFDSSDTCSEVLQTLLYNPNGLSSKVLRYKGKKRGERNSRTSCYTFVDSIVIYFVSTPTSHLPPLLLSFLPLFPHSSSRPPQTL
jgi:hypothetical protein